MEKSKITLITCLSVTIPIIIFFVYVNFFYKVNKVKLENNKPKFILTHGRHYDDIQEDIKKLYKSSNKYVKEKEGDISLRETKSLLNWNKENKKIWNPVKDFKFNFD